METKVIKIDRKNLDKTLIEEAGKLLASGALVAFPTETVYGLGGDGLKEDVAEKIYKAKGRPSDNPLILHISDLSALKVLAVDIPELAYRLAEKFWPGPLTMILKKSTIVPYAVTGGLETVAIRMPSDEIAREIIKASGTYIAAPSANSSTRPSPTKAEHVIEDLFGKVDMIVDGGASDIGLESSIIDLSGDIPVILRPGFITKEDFEEIVAKVEYDKAVLAKKVQESVVAKAPGMKYKHYSPKANVTLVNGELEDFIKYVAEHNGENVYAMIYNSDEASYPFRYLTYGDTAEEQAARVFAQLRSFDEIGAEQVYVRCPVQDGVGFAVYNRLLRSAGFEVINV